MDIELQDSDVVHLKNFALTQGNTFRIDEIKRGVRSKFSGLEPWAEKGVDCELMRVGGKWEKGKIRVKVEFIPDDVSPSPLDDLRTDLKG